MLLHGLSWPRCGHVLPALTRSFAWSFWGFDSWNPEVWQLEIDAVHEKVENILTIFLEILFCFEIFWIFLGNTSHMKRARELGSASYPTVARLTVYRGSQVSMFFGCILVLYSNSLCKFEVGIWKDVNNNTLKLSESSPVLQKSGGSGKLGFGMTAAVENWAYHVLGAFAWFIAAPVWSRPSSIVTTASTVRLVKSRGLTVENWYCNKKK